MMHCRLRVQGLLPYTLFPRWSSLNWPFLISRLQPSIYPFSTQTIPPEERDDAGYADGFDDGFDFGEKEQPRPMPPPRHRRITSPFGRPLEDHESQRHHDQSPNRFRSREEQYRQRRPGRSASDLLPITIQPRKDDDEDAPRYHPSQEPYEGGFVSVDESPYRLREILHVKELWRASMMQPGRNFEDLMHHMRPLSLWQSLHAYLIGGKALQTIQASRRKRSQYEQQIRDIRDAVLSGRFMWKGKGGIFIQGEMRKGMESRMYRSDVKDMEEFIEAQKRKMKPQPVDRDRKSMLEAYFQDRLVTEVMRVIMEPVFEPCFSDFSHGFRPGRTQHTALKQIRRDFADAVWIYRADLRGVFELMLDNRRKFTSHLRRRIEARIDDEAFVDLLFSGLNTHAIMSSYEINPPEEGYSPLNTKSGIIPLLCNVYFDPLDQWMGGKIREINRGKFRRVNPERAALILRGVDEKVADEILPLDPYDPVFRRLCYCRFSDDFVLGLSGPKELAMEVKDEFWSFAAQHLQFPLPSVEIGHTRDKTRFLGHILRRRVIMPRKALLQVRRTKTGRVSEEIDADDIQIGQTTYQIPEQKTDPEDDFHIVSGHLTQRHKSINDGPREILSIDGETDKIVRLLARAGYCHKNGDPQPNFKHLHFAQSETNQNVRRMLLSICDLYRVARNRQRLVHYCSYILRHSVAKMYAAKFKLRSRAKVFKRGGSHLSERIKQGKGYIGKMDPDTGRAMEEYAELPYARLAEVPKPDLLPLPPNWKPEIVHILNEKLLGYAAPF